MGSSCPIKEQAIREDVHDRPRATFTFLFFTDSIQSASIDLRIRLPSKRRTDVLLDRPQP